MILFYAIAILLNFLSTVFLLQTTMHLSPILLHFYAPKDVLTLIMSLYICGALARVIVFWKDIVWESLFKFITLGALGGVAGGLLLNYIPDIFIIIVILFSSAYFLYKFIINKTSVNKSSDNKGVKHSYYELFLSAFMSAFIQVFGMSGGSLRQGYFFSRGYTIANVHGTVAIIYIVAALMTILTRYLSNDINMYYFWTTLPIFPLILITTFYGKKLLFKIPKIWQDRIIIYSLIITLLSTIPLVFKYL
jgi:uncharacterized membrane protein YfcA